MTLDEAIEHAKQVARTCDDAQCAADHIQLAEWLRTARGAEKAARWYTAKIREFEAENAKLRELVQYMHRIIAESCAVQYPYPPEPVSYLSQIEAEKRMRELGVEVDE